jgi:DNA invertase Pin-like site-specific DNA recombinase
VQDRTYLGYSRVSTDEQATTGVSLEGQRRAIAAEADRRGWGVEYYEDGGYTGANSNRPGLQAALEELRTGRAAGLVVARQDRLTRSLLDFVLITQDALRQGWALIALDSPELDPTTPDGELMVNMRAVFARYEQRRISDRIRTALAVKRAHGQRLGRPHRIPGNVMARVVQERDVGRTLWQIADGLTSDGVPTVGGGQRWYASSVRGVLRSAMLDEDARLAREAALTVAERMAAQPTVRLVEDALRSREAGFRADRDARRPPRGSC